MPLSEVNLIKKLVPDTLGITLKDAIEQVPELKEILNGNDLRSQVLREASKLEGSVRNTGVHAAGIIIAPYDLTDIVPVAVAKDSDLLVTQYDGRVIEDAGVIKMDFLGLKTLTIIKDALRMIKQNHGVQIDIDYIPLDDQQTYELYQRGDTNGTFQFESDGMQMYLRELKPDKFEDLIAMNALYRPGPIEYIPNFIARKHGQEPIVFDLPDMEEYLGETYGITVYQEQVMLLSQKLAGFSKGDADVLRKAMGKKQIEILNKMEAQFMDGAIAKGHPKDKLTKIWTDWKAFAQYAFNKSHSTCYAFVAYQTAYLKAHYPSEYMAAVLNNQNNMEKITFFMEECRRMGVEVLGPDINESDMAFAVNKKGQVRFGLTGLKVLAIKRLKALLKNVLPTALTYRL
jgi:DNA polymerase-3 subunit alpha